MVGMYQRRKYGSERVAANILRAVQRNRAVAPEAWVMYALKRLSPALTSWLSRKLRQRLEPPADPGPAH